MVSDNGRRGLSDMSARELTVQLGEQLSRLIREEIALARAELFADTRQAIAGGGLLSGAGLAGHTAWLAMAVAAGAGLSLVLSVWVAVPVLGVLTAAIVAQRQGWLPINSLLRNGAVLNPRRL